MILTIPIRFASATVPHPPFSSLPEGLWRTGTRYTNLLPAQVLRSNPPYSAINVAGTEFIPDYNLPGIQNPYGVEGGFTFSLASNFEYTTNGPSPFARVTAEITYDYPAYMVSSGFFNGELHTFPGTNSQFALEGGLFSPPAPSVRIEWQEGNEYIPRITFLDCRTVSITPVFNTSLLMGMEQFFVRVGGGALPVVPTSTGGGLSQFVGDWTSANRDTLGGAIEWNYTTFEGYEFGWVPLSLGPMAAFYVDGKRYSGGLSPRTFETDDEFVIDWSPSLDIDGNIESARLRVPTSVFPYSHYLDDIVHEEGPKKYRLSWSEIIEYLTNVGFFNGPVPDNYALTLQLIVTGNDGLFDMEVAGVRRGAGRGRFIVRPSGETKRRQGTTLYQHMGAARFWGMVTRNGLMVKSDDEGDTYQEMPNAWSGVTGAQPIMAESLGDAGGMSIARVGNDLMFRKSTDNENWEPAVTVCPYGAGGWCVREHRASDEGRITIENGATNDADRKTYISDAMGETGSWQEVI